MRQHEIVGKLMSDSPISELYALIAAFGGAQGREQLTDWLSRHIEYVTFTFPSSVAVTTSIPIDKLTVASSTDHEKNLRAMMFEVIKL